jgi:DNA-binding transcriptional LysR family regulator
VRLPQINVQQLISFYFVAREESYSAASERLFVTQPAVTRQIKALEAQFGVKLINIRKKRVHLTPAGERLADYAEEILNHVVKAENFLRSYAIDMLHIGVACTLMGYLMPVIDRFKELHSSVLLSVKEGPSLTLIDDLFDFSLDLCVVGTLPSVDKRLHVTRLPELEKMVLVASPDYPLVGRMGVRWEDLVHYPLILQSEGSTARVVILEHFARRNLTPLIGAEVDNIECAKELARQKKGIALMFLPYVKDEVARGRLTIIPVAGEEIRRGIDIVRNREMAVSPILDAFLCVVREHFEPILASAAG